MFRITNVAYLSDIIAYNLAIREEKFSKKKDCDDTRQWMQLETVEVTIDGYVAAPTRHNIYSYTYVDFKDNNIERRLKFSMWDFVHKILFIKES